MRYSPVKVKLIQHVESIHTFARTHGLNVWLVYKVLSGERHNREVQEAVAAFLGESASSLFGADYWGNCERRAG